MPGPSTTRKSCVALRAQSPVRWRPTAAPIQSAAKSAANPPRAGPRRTISSTSIAGRHRNARLSSLLYGGCEMKALMMSKLLSSASAAALALAFSMQAQANPISIAGTFGPVTFTEVQPGNELEVSSPGFQGNAEYQGAGPGFDLGIAVFGAMDFTTTGSLITPPPPNPDPSVPPISQNFPYFSASGVQSFTYQANDDPDNPSMGANLELPVHEYNLDLARPQRTGGRTATLRHRGDHLHLG